MSPTTMSVSMLKETIDHSLRIKFFDLVGIKRDFHYHRCSEYKHAALCICNADTQCAVRRGFQLYAVLKIIVYEGLVGPAVKSEHLVADLANRKLWHHQTELPVLHLRAWAEVGDASEPRKL